MATQNPLKNYDFALEVNGVIEAYVQGVTPPTVEWTEHKQGTAGNNPDKKTPGKKIVGDIIIEQVINAISGDSITWSKFQAAASGLRDQYIENGFLIEFGPGGAAAGVVINRYFIGETWIKKIESSGYDSRGDNSADLMRTVTWSVEDYLLV